jgi:hypothetical protein
MSGPSRKTRVILCRDLWAEIWRDPSTQLNGRGGQAQHGVDIFGCPDEGTAWGGVQCKRTKAGGLDDRAITETVLRAEVKKARQFAPALQAEFVLATTAPRDANIQRIARTITDEHREQGLFPVRVAAWDDIQQHLAVHTKVWARHYSEMVATVDRLSGRAGGASPSPGLTEAPSARAPKPTSERSLRDAAGALLAAAEPARIDLLFPGATDSVRSAIAGLSDVQRRATRMIAVGSRESQAPSVGLLDLAANGGRSLVLAPPGSGKTHALWHAAKAMLDDRRLLPIYLPGGQFQSWQALEAHLADFGVDPRSIFADGRAVVCLDGWTEFGAESPTSHRDALRNFSQARVLATARHSAQHDSRFELYLLERLPVEAVRSAISTSFPTQPQPQGPLLELLTLPLALVLHLLVGGLRRRPQGDPLGG